MSYSFKIKKKKIMFNKNMPLTFSKIPKNPILPTKFWEPITPPVEPRHGSPSSPESKDEPESKNEPKNESESKDEPILNKLKEKEEQKCKNSTMIWIIIPYVIIFLIICLYLYSMFQKK